MSVARATELETAAVPRFRLFEPLFGGSEQHGAVRPHGARCFAIK